MEVTIDSWSDFRESVSGIHYRNWAFRGQSSSDWPVLSTLSRYFRDFHVHQKAQSQQEERILRIFRRKAHHNLAHTPDEVDAFEWLALMQHHGAPTRLIDFTWSPYVAAFFALERATTDAAVWALFPPDISASARAVRPDQQSLDDDRGPWIPKNYEQYFLTNRHRFVVIGEPMQMNKRLIAQAGTFVVPGVLDTPVEALAAEASPQAVVKFILTTDAVREEAMRDLYKMNITHATLFPDIDGLARSLAFELEYHWAFDPATMERYPGYEGKIG